MPMRSLPPFSSRCLLLGAALTSVVAACGSDSPTVPVVSTPDPVSHPEFTITSPERAAMLEQGGLGVDSVVVAGKVCDPRYPIASLTLNGKTVPVSGTDLCPSFNVKVASRWGLTIVSSEATNNRGTKSQLAQAFLRSPAYLPPLHTKTPEAKVSYGIVGNLQTDAIDDHDRTTTNDVGTLLSLFANSLDWNTAVPNPLKVSPDANHDGNIDTYTYPCGILPDHTNRGTGFRITRGALNRGAVAVSVTTASTPPNALRIVATVPNVTIPVSVFGSLDLECAGELDATVAGTLRASSITIGMTEVLEGDSVRFQDITYAASGVVVDVDFSGLAIIDNLVGTITTAVADGVLNENFIGRFFVGFLTPQLNNMIRGLFPTDLLALGGLALSVDPDTSAAPPADDGVLFGESVQAVADAVRPGAAPPKGAPKKGGAAPRFGGPTKKPFGLAVKDDLLNQFFWTAWRKGTFDLASLGSLGCDGTVAGGAVSFASFALLPPVLMAGPGDSVAIGLGDLRLTGTVDRSVVGGTGAPFNMTFYTSAIATGTLAVTTSGAVTLAFAPTPQVAVQIAAINDSSSLEALRSAMAPFFACVAQRLAQTALEHFPVLAITPGKQVPGVPPGSKWEVGSPVVVREGDYTTLRGNVKLQ